MFYLVNPIYFCRHLQYFQQSTATASLWIMVLLSLERSLTFSRPFAVKKLSQTRIICIILLLLTCLCFALHIDELISADIKGFRWENFAYGICSVKRHFYLLAKHIEIVAHANSFILPFLLNSILDVYICYKICQRRKRLSIKSTLLSLNTRDRKKVTRSKRSIAHEITLTLLCQSLWLLLSYFPIHLYYLGISFKSINVHDRENPTFNLFMRQNLLIYLTFSPTLYVIISPTLRKEICSYICQSNNRHRSISLSTYSYTQRKYPNLLNDHCHHLQQPNNEQVIIPLLNNISEQTPEMILSNSIYIPLKIQCASKSEPCLLVHNHEDQCGQNQKMERSNTLQK